jgi:hypothetical protein
MIDQDDVMSALNAVHEEFIETGIMNNSTQEKNVNHRLDT